MCVYVYTQRQYVSCIYSVSKALSVVFPRCFLFHRVLKLLCRGIQVCVCVCTHRDSMFLVSTEDKAVRDRRRALAVSLTHVCV